MFLIHKLFPIEDVMGMKPWFPEPTTKETLKETTMAKFEKGDQLTDVRYKGKVFAFDHYGGDPHVLWLVNPATKQAHAAMEKHVRAVAKVEVVTADPVSEVPIVQPQP